MCRRLRHITHRPPPLLPAAPCINPQCNSKTAPHKERGFVVSFVVRTGGEDAGEEMQNSPPQIGVTASSLELVAQLDN